MMTMTEMVEAGWFLDYAIDENNEHILVGTKNGVDFYDMVSGEFYDSIDEEVF